jgi:hypothetical protein
LIRFTIPLKVNAEYGLNKVYAGVHWSKRKAQAEEIHELVYYSMMQQNVPPVLYKKPVSITIYWDTRLDLDNTAYMRKLVIDGLKGYLIKDDDKRYVRELIDRFHNEENTRIEVREFNG